MGIISKNYLLKIQSKKTENFFYFFKKKLKNLKKIKKL
jgi:hypothetical protein